MNTSQWNYKLRSYVLLLLLFNTVLVAGQTIIKGSIKNEADKAGIAGVSITIKDKNSGNFLNYTLTNDKGEYLINSSGTSDSLLITISGLNIKKQERIIPNKSADLNFSVTLQAIKLQEIIVNPPRIRTASDTINYAIDSFTDKNDRTIGDVLRKLPGIEVKNDGSILYNNKPINKFYIEDKDLLQGRYGIATNNIEAKDVATVQVLENHQPIKALRNKEFTNDAGLNIKLKDSAKGIITASAKAGTGLSPALYDNELFSMYFNKYRQNINTYKGNNTGEDPGTDFTSHYSDPNRTDNSISLSVQSPAPPSISHKRYLFNRAQALSINNLWSFGKETQLSFNISYLNDRQEKSSFSRSMYYLPDSILTIEEGLYSYDKINQVNTIVRINTNKENYYLENLFSFSGQWNQTNGNIIRKDTIYQRLKNPSNQFSNTFNLIKNFKKKSLKFYSFTTYSITPQQLAIRPILYSNLINGFADPIALRQDLNQKKFISNSRMSFAVNNKHFKQNYSVGLNANLQDFKSELREQSSNGSLSFTEDSLRNSLKWNKIEIYASPDYTYVVDKIRLQAILPVNYTQLHYNDALSVQNKNINRLFFNPALIFNYDISSLLSLSADARYSNQIGDVNDVFTSYLMQSYRNLAKNDGKLPETQSQNYSLNINYRHPIHELFVNFGSIYSKSRFNLLYSYNYEGILSIKNSLTIPNNAATNMVFGKISKGIDVIGGTITLYANYSTNRGSQINQGRILDYKNQTFTIRPAIHAKIKSWSSLSYTFQFTQSKNILVNEISSFIPIRGTTQSVQLNFFPSEGLTIYLANEYFYSSAISNGNRTMGFTDAGIRYLYKKMEFNIDYMNILNAKQYISASYLNTNSYYYAYNLRPAQVLLKVRFKIQ